MPWRAGLIALGLAGVLGGADAAQAMQCKPAYPEFCAGCAEVEGAFAGAPADLAIVRGRAVWTPLYAAYFHDCPDQARAFLERGADPNLGGDHGDMLSTIVLWDRLAEDRRLDWARLLLDHGARLDFVARDGVGVRARLTREAAGRPDVARLWRAIRAHPDGS